MNINLFDSVRQFRVLSGRSVQIGAVALLALTAACAPAPGSKFGPPAGVVASGAITEAAEFVSELLVAPAPETGDEGFGEAVPNNPLNSPDATAVADLASGNLPGSDEISRAGHAIYGRPVVIGNLPYGKCLRVFSHPSRYAPSVEVGCAVNGQQGTVISQGFVWAEGTKWVAVSYPVPYSVNRHGVIKAWSDASYVYFR